MKNSKTLLVIEDEPAIVRFLRSCLGAWNFLEAGTKAIGLQLAAEHRPDVILLDLALPEGGALSFLKVLRQWASAPIILMGSHGQENVQVAGLEAGANDFLVKPFTPQELLTRLQLALRHTDKQGPRLPIYEHRGLRVDLYAHRVWLLNKEVHLSPTQYECLAVLVRHAGRLVTQSQLMKAVWGQTREVTLDALRVFIHELRQKIETDPVKPRCLKTEPGFGYRLELPEKNIFKKSPGVIRTDLSVQSAPH